MKNDARNYKLPGAVWGLLIFMACVLIALIIYWAIAVSDIMEQRRAAENTAVYLQHIHSFSKYPLT